MQAWRVEQIIDPATLPRRAIAVPEPAPDQYLVKVEPAGVAFGDTLIVRGQYQVTR